MEFTIKQSPVNHGGYYIDQMRLDYIRLDNFLVPMQCTGNLGWGKRAAIVLRYPAPTTHLILVYSGFAFSYHRLCEAYHYEGEASKTG